jgi:hypothetical protein
MGTVLLTWELGGGLGHLTQLGPLSEGLAARGHRVVAALRDLSRAKSVFNERVRLLQAPLAHTSAPPERRGAHTFAQILINTGFGDARQLSALTEAWRNVYEMVRPDLIVFDHSPMALFAAQGLAARKAVIGLGFFCPPDEYPLRNLRPWEKADPGVLRGEEDALLGRMNEQLKRWGRPPLPRVSALYGTPDDVLLATFRELDHYPDRPAARYWGPMTKVVGGAAPVWPQGSGGKRIFAYLKPFPVLPDLIRLLAESGHPTIVYASGIDPALRERFGGGGGGGTIAFSDEPLDMSAVGRECDLAACNANHGTIADVLLAGKPLLMLPISLEQTVLARATQRLGVGLGASPTDGGRLEQVLGHLLTRDDFRRRAEVFARRYADFDGDLERRRIVERLEELVLQR